MDTDAIYLEVCNYGRSCRARNVMDEADHMQMIVSLLNNADEEHKSLLAENERLVDEVAEARKETGEQARLNGMGAEREARLMAEVSEIKAKLTDKASLLRGCYARINVLEKAVNDAIPAMREYARKNPKHYWNDAQQDPNGAHAWLARNDGAALEQKE